MLPSIVGSLAGPELLAAVGEPLQVVPAVTEASTAVRASAAFALVFALGASIRWRYGEFLDRAIEASTATPVAALGYGLAAHAVIAFVGVYLANRLTRYGVFGSSSGYVGVGVGFALVGVAGALGFTVVGSAVTDLLGGERGWAGPFVGAVVAAGTAALAPAVGALCWFGIVSVGIGGAVRRWIRASAVAEIEAEQSS